MPSGSGPGLVYDLGRHAGQIWPGSFAQRGESAYFRQVRGRDLVSERTRPVGEAQDSILQPTILTLSAVILTGLGLGFYTVHKMNPGSFKVQTSLWRVFSFIVEIKSTGRTEKPSSEQGSTPTPEAKAIPPGGMPPGSADG